MSWAGPLYRRLATRATDWRSKATEALFEAYRVRFVRRGMLGCLLIAIGGLSPAFLPANSPWWGVFGAFREYTWLGPTMGTVAALAGVLLVMDAWFHLRPVEGAPEVDFRAVLALWSLPMLLAPPIFSHDSYAYAAEGYMVHEGLNPYEMGAGMLQNRWGEQVVEVWRFTRAPYGPLSLQLSHLVVDVFGLSPYWSSAVGMRMLAIAGIVAVAYGIPPIAERLRVSPRRAMWFGLVNPLAIAHLVGGAHNDAVMIGFIVLALLAATKRRFLLGCVLVGAAAAVKIPAILAIVPVAMLGWGVRRPAATSFGRLWQAGWRVFVATLVMVAALTFITLACLPDAQGWGWIQAINVPGMVSTISPPTLLGDLARIILNELGYHREALGTVRLSRQIAMVIMVVVILVMLVRMAPTRPMRFLVYAWMALILGSPALHPWYLTWPAIFLAFARPSPLIVRISCWASIGLLTYSSVSFSWRNDLTAVGVAAVAVVIWMILAHDRRHFRHLPRPRSERAEVADRDPEAIEEPVSR